MVAYTHKNTVSYISFLLTSANLTMPANSITYKQDFCIPFNQSINLYFRHVAHKTVEKIDRKYLQHIYVSETKP